MQFPARGEKYMSQRSALITGASGDIGRAIAVTYAKNGFSLKLTGRDEARLIGTAELIRELEQSVDYRIADLTDMDSVSDLASWAVEDSTLAAVVLVAGGGRYLPVGPDSLIQYEEIISLILRSQMRIAAETLPTVRQNKGQYIFFGGMMARMSFKSTGAYSAARHGIQGFSESMFEDVRDDCVRVTSLHPGYINTRLIVPNTRLDRQKLIQLADISHVINMLITMPLTTCPTEIILRPQQNP
jgi:3-oxoacyl-[acyl-carrier protein] reductase